MVCGGRLYPQIFVRMKESLYFFGLVVLIGRFHNQQSQ